ncbi:Gcd10p-domain-containing protein [Coniophora puteana RWD-64-598 SS2]|uniref:tRNA (adenine(58)-N(1))-methyltransferase non-catalytic subunit TRM6 n=1 Tax=Coniophora puteana (strain RWD-64-598) TaxID=741705 RepID=A0A5M3N6B0_CONPW|nr:Gcd10p-domain-containing protein [Coniophora puteana RWD-64-598 SS2]EIW86980.1 Gcd10p-domain-containing protein [Coniophora puteana RWD-64-598 SS2]
MDEAISSVPMNNLIQSGHTVLFRLLNGETRGLKVDHGSAVSLGRLGSFPANALIGQRYGLTHEIQGKELNILPPRVLQEVEDTDATNELITDGELVQPLTITEIEALKQSGAHAADIIKAQIEQHANYELKTEYSKEKYKRRKEAKYMKAFTTVEPTLHNVCEYWFKKDHNRIRDLRPDTLSQMLNLGSIRPGGRYLAVDDASGLVISAVLHRLGGEGRLISICDVDSPPAYPVMAQMNFAKDIIAPLGTLNWATAQPDYAPAAPQEESSSGEPRSDRHRQRLDRRKLANDALQQTRNELFSGEFDGLLVSTEYDAFEVVQTLSPYLAGSACIVVQHPYQQPLTELQMKMRAIPSYLGPSITESWSRRYQVLPGRTHPMMSTSGTGGFLLHAIKV